MTGAYTVPELPAGSYKVHFTPESFGESEYLESQWYKGEPSEQEATVVTLSASQGVANIDAHARAGRLGQRNRAVGRRAAADRRRGAG